MPDIHFECPSCKHSLAAPKELASQLIECPTCNQTIEVPVRSKQPNADTLPPQIPIQAPPKPSRTTSGAPQPVRRHSIFYYVFWGTVSLFATLAILFLAFFFLTATGAGFLSALTGRTPNTTEKRATHAVRNLPALTEDEGQAAKRLMRSLRVKKDDIEGITWYSPDVADGFETAVYLYIGKKGTGEPWLRWKIRYYGDNWLFIRRYRIKIDQEEAKTLLPTEQIKHDNGSGSVWEIFDESATDHAHLLNQILASKTTYLRMEGTDGVNDMDLGPQQLRQMRDVILVYRYLGGVWPAN